MSAVINVLAVVGFLAIIIYVIYNIWKYFDKVNRENTLAKIRPSATYMQNVGIKCPDYWDLVKVDETGNYVCQDTYGLITKYQEVDRARDMSNCVDINLSSSPSDYDKVAFVGLGDGFHWDTMTDEEKIAFTAKANKDGVGSVSRADWIRECGAGPGINAVWSGFESYVR
jgi:hypothetical protein